jgi:hypothetical protein
MRIQVSLSSEEHRGARLRAADLGISFAEYVRRLVRDDLAEQPVALPGDVSAIFALGDSGAANVASNKDHYVGEAIKATQQP